MRRGGYARGGRAPGGAKAPPDLPIWACWGRPRGVITRGVIVDAFWKKKIKYPFDSKTPPRQNLPVASPRVMLKGGFDMGRFWKQMDILSFFIRKASTIPPRVITPRGLPQQAQMRRSGGALAPPGARPSRYNPPVIYPLFIV